MFFSQRSAFVVVAGCDAATRQLVTVIAVVSLVVAGLDVSQAAVALHHECSLVAIRFNELQLPSGSHMPSQKINDADLEVCSTAAAQRHQSVVNESKTCCTRVMERRLHQRSMDDAKEAIISSTAWKRFAALEPLSNGLRDELYNQMLAAGNATVNMLETNYLISDSDCHGHCISPLFIDLAKFASFDNRSSDSFNFQSHISRMLDKLFATIYFRHVQRTLGGESSGHVSASNHRHRPQHFQQHQQYVECIASVRTQLNPAPMSNFEMRLAVDLEQSINITKLLVEAFDVAASTIRWTTGDQIQTTTSSSKSSTEGTSSVLGLLHGHQCSQALTRMRHCSLCNGLDSASPCRSMCLNVARGCMAPLVAGEHGGLGQSWDLFINVVAQLASGIGGSYDLDRVLTEFVSRLSLEIGALLQTMETIDGNLISSKCGHYAGLHSSTGETHHEADNIPPMLPNADRRNRIPKVMSKFRHMALALTGVNGFYSRLAEPLCRHDAVSSQLDICWNGTAIGRYTHAITHMHIGAQATSNPEVRVSDEPPEAFKTVTSRLSNMTKLMHSRIPPRPSLTPHALIQDSIDSSSDYSGDYDYGPYDDGNWYPVDDEDGYESGSGSDYGSTWDGEDEGHISVIPPLVEVDHHRTTADIVFQPTTPLATTRTDTSKPSMPTATTKRTSPPATTKMPSPYVTTQKSTTKPLRFDKNAAVAVTSQFCTVIFAAAACVIVLASTCLRSL